MLFCCSPTYISLWSSLTHTLRQSRNHSFTPLFFFFSFFLCFHYTLFLFVVSEHHTRSMTLFPTPGAIYWTRTTSFWDNQPQWPQTCKIFSTYFLCTFTNNLMNQWPRTIFIIKRYVQNGTNSPMSDCLPSPFLSQKRMWYLVWTRSSVLIQRYGVNVDGSRWGPERDDTLRLEDVKHDVVRWFQSVTVSRG